MRLVIEVTEAEREALRQLINTNFPTTGYSTLFRTLLAMCIDGSIPPKDLITRLASQRPVINVAFTADLQTNSSVNGPDVPLSQQEKADMVRYMTEHKLTKLNNMEWRARVAQGQLVKSKKK